MLNSSVETRRPPPPDDRMRSGYVGRLTGFIGRPDPGAQAAISGGNLVLLADRFCGPDDEACDRDPV